MIEIILVHEIFTYKKLDFMVFIYLFLLHIGNLCFIFIYYTGKYCIKKKK